MNVVLGERYKTITKETRGILTGEYGATPLPVNAELQKRVLEGKAPITVRPADLIEPELEKLTAELDSLAAKKNFTRRGRDDVLTYALFPEVGLRFLEHRGDPSAFEPAPGSARAARAAAPRRGRSAAAGGRPQPSTTPSPSTAAATTSRSRRAAPCSASRRSRPSPTRRRRPRPPSLRGVCSRRRRTRRQGTARRHGAARARRRRSGGARRRHLVRSGSHEDGNRGACPVHWRRGSHRRAARRRGRGRPRARATRLNDG